MGYRRGRAPCLGGQRNRPWASQFVHAGAGRRGTRLLLPCPAGRSRQWRAWACHGTRAGTHCGGPGTVPRFRIRPGVWLPSPRRRRTRERSEKHRQVRSGRQAQWERGV